MLSPCRSGVSTSCSGQTILTCALPVQRSDPTTHQFRARGGMRKVSDAERIRRFMRAFGAEAVSDARTYFTGGATAVLLGWRDSTIAIDLRIFPESDRLFRALPSLKETLEINVELASPASFLFRNFPAREDRSLFIAREGRFPFFITIFTPRSWPRSSPVTNRISRTCASSFEESGSNRGRLSVISRLSNHNSTAIRPSIRRHSEGELSRFSPQAEQPTARTLRPKRIMPACSFRFSTPSGRHLSG